MNTPKQRVFQGSIYRQMPNMYGAGLIPMAVADFMQTTLGSLGGIVDTGDAVAQYPNGKVKIVRDSQLIRELSQESTLDKTGALVLEPGVYEAIDEEELPQETVRKYTGRTSIFGEVLMNPLWRTLARDDKTLRAFASEIFACSKRYGHQKNMGIQFGQPSEQPTMRVVRLAYGDGRFTASAYQGLNNPTGHTIGIPQKRPLLAKDRLLEQLADECIEILPAQNLPKAEPHEIQEIEIDIDVSSMASVMGILELYIPPARWTNVKEEVRAKLKQYILE